MKIEEIIGLEKGERYIEMLYNNWKSLKLAIIQKISIIASAIKLPGYPASLNIFKV